MAAKKEKKIRRGSENLKPLRPESKLKVAERRAKVCAMLMREVEAGRRRGAQARIAAHFKIGTDVVTRDIQAAIGDWKEEAIGCIETMKLEEYEEQKKISTAAWEEFNRSKQKRSETHVETLVDKDNKRVDGGISKVRQITRDPIGEARFLTTLISASERRARLIGMDAAQKNENRNVNTNGTQAVDPTYSIAQLKAVVRGEPDEYVKAIGRVEKEYGLLLDDVPVVPAAAVPVKNNGPAVPRQRKA